jgi:hypothetical protein
MATLSRKTQPQHWIVRFLPLQTLTNAQNLAHRFREADGFRLYVHERMALLVPALLVTGLISIACAIGVVVFLADHHALLALLGILLLPIVLVGSFFVQAYIFVSWIEGRALARELGNRHRAAPGVAALWLARKFRLDLGPGPDVPWLLATVFLVAPLAVLAASWLSFALITIFLGLLMPVVYAKLDGPERWHMKKAT